MKKIFFLICALCVFALTGQSNAWGVSFNDHSVWKRFFAPSFQMDTAETRAVIFHQRRARQIPEPLIEEETLETAEKIFFSPLAMMEKYNHLTLLILTNILLVLTVTRRKQMEKAQRAATA
ncbi:MAG TPA: hypothetical protein P5294_10575 [Smithellaceae bacterium]|nr:hypothetical protein [Smithellaceae bacterium]HRS90133.1 hypothetical protein [Smithellaceae bacterium]HRV26974.1 hypothetical protein [Smithellaceae bacterium]